MSGRQAEYRDAAALSRAFATEPAPLVAEASPAVITRDIAVDVLRGWAIVLMIASHVGPSTRVSAILHIPWYITAANWFVTLSGLVLGMVSARRIRTAGPGQTYSRILARTFTLWLIHCILMFSVVIFHETTGRLHYVTSVRAVGGWLRVLWMVPALRLNSNDFMNILPMYVTLLGLTPIALECLRRRKTGWLLLASVTLYAVAQRYPEWGRQADPITGKRIFNIEAWQFAYVCGLCVGFHRDRIAEEIWPRYRTYLLPISMAIFGAVFLFAQLQRTTFAWMGFTYPAAAPYFWGKLTAAPGQMLYFFAMAIVSYWLVRKAQEAKVSAFQVVLDPLATLGRYSLYCFLVHLVFSLAARACDLNTQPMWLQEVLTITAIGATYLMAKNRVFAKFIPN